MDEKKVSVIIPVYNSEEYVVECINSIIEQTYKNIEIIIVDDGSSDQSYEKCKRLEEENSAITVLHQNNCGSGAARNFGMTVASGDYLSFVDSDDLLEKDFLRYLVDSYENNDVSFSACGLCFFTNSIFHYNNQKMETKIENNIIYLNKMLCGDYAVSVVNKLYDFTVVKNNDVQFETNHQFWEDLRFNIDYLCVSNKQKVVHVMNNLYYARKREGSQTRTRKQTTYQELLNSTRALWETVCSKYAQDKQLISSASCLYGMVIINCFYEAGFGMNVYDRKYVEKQLAILNELAVKFNIKTTIKYALMKRFSRILFFFVKMRT